MPLPEMPESGMSAKVKEMLADLKLDLESKNLYDHLGIPSSSSDKDIKKAYHRLALHFHPDKNPGFTSEFHKVGRAYSILSDAQSRKLYDETGLIQDESLDGMDGSQFEAYFRNLYQKVRMEDIDAFRAEYIGSVEECMDVLASYRRNRGDISAIADDVFFGDEESAIDRFTSIINQAINKGIIDQERAFTKLCTDTSALDALKRKRKRTADKEAKEAEQLAKELGIGRKRGEADLHAVIKGKRKDNFESMIAGLEAKYASKPKKSMK